MPSTPIVPDFTFLRSDGTPVRLQAFLQQDFLLLVFFRHMACILCNTHMGEVDAARAELASRGCSVLGITQAQPEQLRDYESRATWHVPLVCDPDRAAYRFFGLERTSWLTFFRLRELVAYFRGMFRGYGVRKPYAGEDVLQLGGDFILSSDRKVLYAHPSRRPADRPRIPDLLRFLESVRPISPVSSPDVPRVDAPSTPG